jgi:NADPH2:quinone reductase
MSAEFSATVVLATAFGGPEVLQVVEQPLPEPGPGEVVLEVRGAGVNPVDWKLYSGMFGADEAALPMALGFEASGVVTAVGAGAAGPIEVGDEVVGYRVDGAYADRVVVSTDALVPKPAGLSFEAAAGLMLAGATAVHALAATAVGDGDTLLLHAASGGVGLIAVQLAVARGARVIGTASEAHHEELRSLGAEPVTYGDGLAGRVKALAPDGVDAAIDGAGTEESLDVSLELVSDRDRIAAIANFARGFEAGVKVLGGAPGADHGTEIRAAARSQLAELAAAGKLSVPTTTLPLAQAAEAHRMGIAGRVHGKMVLVP